MDDGAGGGASTVDGLLAAINEGTTGRAATCDGLCPSGIDRDVVGGAVDKLGTPELMVPLLATPPPKMVCTPPFTVVSLAVPKTRSNPPDTTVPLSMPPELIW